MIDVLFVYEHKVRELETICLLKSILEIEGYSSDILWIRNFKRLKYFCKYKPRIIVTPYLYSDAEVYDAVISICGKNRKIINLQWEQVFNGDSASARRNPTGIAKDAVHVCWGEVSYNRLKKSGVQKAILTGPPQMDLLKTNFDSYFYSKEELIKKYNLSNSKKIILFISSFSYYSLSDKEVQNIAKLVDFNPFEFRDVTIKTKDELLIWFKKFLDENSGYQIIYRPHPSEHTDKMLLSISENYSNFHVISDESVKQWIKTSDFILNWYSTSGVEAYFMEKPNIFLRPFELPKNQEYKMYANALKINTYKEFEKKLLHFDDIEINNSKVLIRDISNYYLIDNECASTRIINIIKSMFESNKYDIDYNICTNNQVIKALIRNLIKLLVISLYNTFPCVQNTYFYKIKSITKIIKDYSSHINDYVNKEEIELLNSKIVKILNQR